MSDDNSKYDNGTNMEAKIKSQLAQLTQDQLIDLKSNLTADMEHINRYFAEYFENLPSPDPAGVEVKAPSKLSTIFTNAWYYMKKGIYASFSECLRAAWKAYKMVKALKGGVVSFAFRKATGEIRQATGTLSSDHFTYSSKGVRSESKPDAIKYYDLGSDAWRMFRIERLITTAA